MVARKKDAVTWEAEERVELQKMVTSGKGATRKRTDAQGLLVAGADPEGPGRADAQVGFYSW